MLSFTGSLRVWLAVQPCDMRKSFNGLEGLVREKLKQDPCSGALFLFSNRRRTLMKILYWDGTGLWVLAKRLEKGTFCWPKHTSNEVKIKFDPTALVMLTDGIELRDGHRLPWYEES